MQDTSRVAICKSVGALKNQLMHVDYIRSLGWRLLNEIDLSVRRGYEPTECSSTSHARSSVSASLNPNTMTGL